MGTWATLRQLCRRRNLRSHLPPRMGDCWRLHRQQATSFLAQLHVVFHH